MHCLWNNFVEQWLMGKLLFGAASLSKNDDIGKCKYSGYGLGFDTQENFSFPTSAFGKNVIFFQEDMSSSANVDKKKKYFKKNSNSCWKSHTRIRWYKINCRKKYSISFKEF